VLFRPAASPSFPPLLLLLSCIYTLFSLSPPCTYVCQHNNPQRPRDLIFPFLPF
jgi:hypothetical protein